MSEREDFARMHTSGIARQMFDLLGEELIGAQQRLDKDLFNRLDRGLVITPDEALQFIAMKFAQHKLINSLQSKITQGTSAGSRLTPLMNGAQNAA